MISLPEWLPEMKELQTLNLTYNHLISLPKSIGRLKKLKLLFLGWNQLKTLPEELGELKKLENLALHRNQFNSVPEVLRELRKLKRVSLESNNLITLPNWLFELPTFTSLDARPNLEEDWQDKMIMLGDNPIESPPLSVLAQGMEATRTWFRESKKQNSKRLLEAKIVIVGAGESGKTTLINKLKDENYPVPDKNIRTEGIEVWQWPLKGKKKWKSPPMFGTLAGRRFTRILTNFSYRPIHSIYC